jgi:hypothetical protein
MLKRITLKTPGYTHAFGILNGTLSRHFTWWEFYPDWQTLEQLHDLEIESAHPKLSEILRAVGSHATLWIGDWQGTIAPMDIPPEGWTYPSGRPLEPEWWWQWFPSDRAESEAKECLNMNPIDAWSVNSPLKFGIPFQMQRNLGDVQEINAIPMMRLPDLVKKEVLWTFEFEVKDDFSANKN